MKYKALILDLDGTTLVHGKENMPSLRVTQAIAKARKIIHVCVATGRPLDLAMPVLSHLQLSGPCIINNGTLIYDPESKRYIHEVVLPKDALPKIYAIARSHDVDGVLFDGKKDHVYAGGVPPEKVLSYYLPQIVPNRLQFVMDDLMKIPDVAVHKLDAWDKQYMSIDVTGKEASKLHGIIEVARLLNVKTEEIIGIGDGYNDFPLLMASGLKIAMGNAVPELKDVADFIAPSVEEDGVAVVIEKFILSAS
ncbi:HAD family phosphatase [Candidatus Gottesmanbacteria bacterium]|nr:HAD family phosphatase [Candidatus Gottesmanbacteria bacterium]